MRIVKRIILVLLVIVLLAILAGVIFVRNISRKGLPDYNQDVKLTGLQYEVRVYRDKYAIPHIYAKTGNDLYMAVGYLLAQDRLWQMDLIRRVTLGRISEIFGENFVETDLLLRALRFSDKSERILKELDEKNLAIIKAFCEGVNQYIKSNLKNMPVEFTILGYKPDPWEPLHTLNLLGYMAWDLKAGWDELVLDDIRKTVDSERYSELLPDYSTYKSVVYPGYDSLMSVSDIESGMYVLTRQLEEIGADIFDASNNWAVSEEKSSTGKPILANDMHLGLNIPGIWYQMHQVIENKLNVTGLVLPGAPFVICGHNEHIAWGMTNTYVDNVDFYLEIINPEDSNKYEFNGDWKDMVIKKEIIKTKEGKEIEKEIKFTHHGPVISKFKKIKDKAVTMRWVGDEPSNEFLSVYLLNRASDWKEFREALKTFKNVSQNIVYADVHGNIGMYCAAGVPVRKRTEIYPLLPGWIDDYEWKGMVAFNKLPYSKNPVDGFVASANNKTVGEDYAYHIGTWYALPYRMDRIKEVLSGKEVLLEEDFIKLQLDQKSKLAEKYLPLILNAIDSNKLQLKLEKEGFGILKKWDGSYNKENIAASIFETCYEKLIENIFSDELGDELYNRLLKAFKVVRITLDKIVEREGSKWLDNISTENYTESLNDIIEESYKNAISYLQQEYGDDIQLWKWGNIHQFTLRHPLSTVKILDKIFKLNRGPFKVGGSFHTVSPFNYPFGKPSEVNSGASNRNIYTLYNWDSSLTVIPTGNSGIPSSRHYCDQTELYISGKYHRDYFSGEQVKKNTQYKMTFKPADNPH
jgi:penicillin amidase